MQEHDNSMVTKMPHSLYTIGIYPQLSFRISEHSVYMII